MIGNKSFKKGKKRGFTLIELLVVIGIIAILAAIVFVAVDPATRLAQARNARRFSEVTSILNALLQYQVDVPGNQLPNNQTNATPCFNCSIDNVPGSVQLIGATNDIVTEPGGATCVALAPTCPGAPSAVTLAAELCFVNLAATDLLTGAGTANIVDTYLASIPLDPLTGTAADTRYFVNVTAGGRITVGVCDQELGVAISVSR